MLGKRLLRLDFNRHRIPIVKQFPKTALYFIQLTVWQRINDWLRCVAPRVQCESSTGRCRLVGLSLDVVVLVLANS